MTRMSDLSLEEIRHALTTARRLGISEVRLSKGEETFRARLAPDWEEEPELTEAPSSQTAGPLRKAVTAPVVGYFRPGPQWILEGDVEQGKPLAEVTALGLSNEVRSTMKGRLVELLAEDGDPVEYGQILGWVEE